MIELLHAINWLYVASGFVVGFLVGLTGVGGGALMTPILVLVFGVPPATAVGTDLLYAAATKAGGSLVHAFHHSIDWRVVGRLALGSVPAATITLGVLEFLDVRSEATSHLITKVLGVALLLTAIALVFRPVMIGFYSKRAEKLSPKTIRTLTIATGATLGFLVALSSVGAGALGVTALILLYPNLPTLRVVGSDIAHAVPLTLVAGAGHFLLGGVDIAMLGSLLLGSLPGIILSSNIAPRAPERVLRYGLAVVLALVSAKLLA